MFKIIHNNKYPLFLIFTIQLIGLIVFAVDKVQEILPTGNNNILDTLYSNPNTVHTTYYLIAIIGASSLLFRDDKRIKLILVSISVLILTWLQQMWLSLLLYPLLIKKDSAVLDTIPIDPYSEFRKYPFSYIGIAIFLAGLALMTIQIPFPHHVSFIDVIYMHSLSMVLILFGSLLFFVVILIYYQFLKNAVNSKLINTSSFYYLFIIIFFILFYFYSYKTFAPFIQQYNLASAELMISGLLTTIILFVFGDFIKNSTNQFDFTVFNSSLSKKWFWIKFLICFMFIRQSYIWLTHTDQNFLTVFIYDIINVLVPFIAVWLFLGLSIKLFKKVNHPKLFRVLSFLLIVISIMPALLYCKENWTLNLEMNRTTAQYFTSKSRSILKFVGWDIERYSNEKVRVFKDSIKKSIKTDNLSNHEVFQVNHNSFQKSDYHLNPMPHIFIILADAVYAQHLSVYGYNRDTSPNLNEFSKQSIIFDHFYSTSSATSQGVASLFTGYYIGNYPNQAKENRGSLCQTLRLKNYTFLLSELIKTVSFPKNGRQCENTILLSYSGTDENDWVKIKSSLNNDFNKPLFVYLHIKGGHDPWILNDEDKIFGKNKIDVYDALLHKSDRQFLGFLEKIKKLGIYENSIIIFTSDHGIGLGKHLDQASYSRLFNVNINIPFLIKYPGILPSRVKNIYSLVDVRTSLEDMLGIKSKEKTHGMSFKSDLISETNKNERCVFGTATYSDIYSMQCYNGLKIIFQRKHNFLEIYNSFSDPYEIQSIAKNYTTKEFMSLAKPFIHFMAYGKNTYAIEN